METGEQIMFSITNRRAAGIVSSIVLALGVSLFLGGVVLASQSPPGLEGRTERLPGEVSPALSVAPAAGITSAIPIQGRLTDAGGTPLNGSHTIRMRMYLNATTPNFLCEDTDTVNVVNGLFIAYFSNCSPASFHGGIFPLHLGIKVDGDPEMSPRQPLSTVPVASTLVDGAVIDTMRSVTETEIAVSPLKFVQSASSSLSIEPQPDGYIRIDPVSAGTHVLYVPVDVPSKLFGVPFHFRRMRVCYHVESALNIISTTAVRMASDDGGWVDMKVDLTDRNSLTWDCYTINDIDQHTIDGPLVLQFTLICTNTTDRIRIGKITLSLAQQ